jgi:hypothetical protein
MSEDEVRELFREQFGCSFNEQMPVDLVITFAQYVATVESIQHLEQQQAIYERIFNEKAEQVTAENGPCYSERISLQVEEAYPKNTRKRSPANGV